MTNVKGSIHVVGAGGIGATVGRALIAGGYGVLFVEADPAKVAATGPGRCVRFANWRPPADVVILLCVKCYDNPTVLTKVPATATLIPIQNGFDPALDAFGHQFEGIASFVAKGKPGERTADITRPGELHLGPRAGAGGTTTDIAWLKAALELAGRVPVTLVDRIEPIKHTKLMYNAAISPLAAAAGVDNGQLLSLSSARRLFFALLRENYAILSMAGCELGKVGPFEPGTVARILRRRWLAWLLARAFEPSLRGTYCSMAGEIETGRTELDHYTGHLLRLAETAGVSAPVNRAVYDVVKRMEAAKATPRREVLREIAGVL